MSEQAKKQLIDFWENYADPRWGSEINRTAREMLAKIKSATLEELYPEQ